MKGSVVFSFNFTRIETRCSESETKKDGILEKAIDSLRK